jgi:hypothetical protein
VVLTASRMMASPVTTASLLDIMPPSARQMEEPHTTSGATLMQYAFMMTQATAAPGGIDPNWILLDSQSTISVFNNRNMLRNIRRSPHVLRALTNGGFQDSNMVGEFPNSRQCLVQL